MRISDSSEIIEITIRDSSGRKLESKKFSSCSIKDIIYISNWLYNKYGIKFSYEDNKTFTDL